MSAVKDNACDKCRKNRSELYLCIVCRTTTCQVCHMACHNKPESKNHKKILKKMNVFDYKFSYELPITFFSADFYRTQFFSKDMFVQVAMESIHRILFAYTRAGNPMMLHHELGRAVAEEMGVQLERVLDFLESSFHCPTIKRTVRSFGGSITLKYFSLCLSMVSVESIVWILKSICNDRMQPNESLMFSRFKEYFDIKISMKEWKRLIESLVKSKDLLASFNQHRDVFDEIGIQEIDEGNYLFLLRETKWVYEDLSAVTDQDPDYQAFLAYIDEFFTEGVAEADRGSEIKKWLVSVESSKKRASNLNLESNYRKIIQNENINKAIPGGKYGCTLLIKNCGTPLLKQLSIGRIYALIKHGLNNQVISHLKTHIVKNDQKVTPKTQDRDQQILELQIKVLELLKEQEKESVTLAQLPLLLMKKYDKFYNFQELGFIKLKNFLLTMEDKIELTRSSNNHIKVSLRKRKEPPFTQMDSSGFRSPAEGGESKKRERDERLWDLDSSQSLDDEGSGFHMARTLRNSQKHNSQMNMGGPRTVEDLRIPLSQTGSRFGTKTSQSPRSRYNQDSRSSNPQRVAREDPGSSMNSAGNPLNVLDLLDPKEFHGTAAFINPAPSKLIQKNPNKSYTQVSDHFRVPQPFVHTRTSHLTMAELSRRFESIRNFVLEKIKSYPFGLEMKKLEREVSEFIGEPFYPPDYKANTFRQFLVENFQNELEINPKKAVKSKNIAKRQEPPADPELMIYPKNTGHSHHHVPSFNDSFESMNKSGNSGHLVHSNDNQVYSDTSQGNARTRLGKDGSNSDWSNRKPSSAYNHYGSSNCSNKEEDDNLDRIFQDGYDSPPGANDSHADSRYRDYDNLDPYEDERPAKKYGNRFVGYLMNTDSTPNPNFPE